MSLRGEIGLVLLLVAALSFGVAAGRRRAAPAQVDDRTSTLLAGPGGSKALYEVQARLGQPVERRRTPLFTLARDAARRPALLVVAAPPLPLSPGELDEVVRFVESGGAVFGAAGAGGITRCVGWAVVRLGAAFRPESAAVAAPAPGLVLPPVRRVLRESAAGARAAGRVSGKDAPGEDEGEGEGVLHAVDEGDTRCSALRPLTVDTLVRTVTARPVVVRLRYAGGGRVTLLSAPEYLRNRIWRATDVPYVLAPLLAPPRPGLVSWDEYHQGFGDAPSLAGVVLSWLVRAPIGWMLLHLAIVALIALAVAALRFGPARPGIARSRRSPLEHVEALAAGLEGAGGTDTAVHLILGGLRRRLSRAAAPSTGDAGQWLAALELALPGARGREAARRLQTLLHHPGGAERALAAAHAVEDVWEELRPRRIPG